MLLAPATRLGPYEILSSIAAGGMGEVYKARDTRLDRIVAIKVSKEQFSERVQQEAQAVAALNHPHILTLFDVGPNYLVMEYIEGAPPMGPLPVEEAVQYAGEICEALDAAHQKGITHRDLKPANILVTKQGIKLLDFGIAKVPGRPLQDNDTTLTDIFKEKGYVLGSLHYMAPEQLRGRNTDARSDIFSFGAVLYEMLTGKRAFDGPDQASIIAAILRSTPEPLSVELPPLLQKILETCLEKDPDARFQSARDLKLALQWSVSEGAGEAVVPKKSGGRWLPWALAGAALLIAAAIAVVHFRTVPAEARMIKFTVPVAEQMGLGYSALSPDGRKLAFLARDQNGQAMLFVRALDSLTAQPLAGTDGALYPFWSPDSKSIGFFTGRSLKRIDANGGPAQPICEMREGLRGATWGANGTILIAENLGGISRVAASGGTPERVTELDPARKETRHYWPSFLPDGQHFLFEVTSSLPQVQGVWVASVANPSDRRRLLPDLSQASFALGYLLFVRGDNLMAQPFETSSLALKGEAIPIVDKVPSSVTVGWADFSASTNGVIAIGTAAGERRMTWFDRTGKAVGAVGGQGRYLFATLSPDQNKVAVDSQGSQSGYEVLVFDLVRGTTTPLTVGKETGNFPVWSPDGTRIAFGSSRDGVYNIYVKSVSGASQDEVLLKNEHNKFLTDWSRDGRYLLYGQHDPKAKVSDLWTLSMPVEKTTAERKPILYIHSDGDKRDGRFSPDGRWVAYSSDESKEWQVYVQSFPVPSQRWQISTDGGTRPRWREDGKELFFIEPGGKLMAVETTTGSTFQADTPKPLFDTGNINPLFTYDVGKAGQRFVMPAVAKSSNADSVTVIVNFTAGLRK